MTSDQRCGTLSTRKATILEVPLCKRRARPKGIEKIYLGVVSCRNYYSLTCNEHYNSKIFIDIQHENVIFERVAYICDDAENVSYNA